MDLPATNLPYATRMRMIVDMLRPGVVITRNDGVRIRMQSNAIANVGARRPMVGGIHEDKGTSVCCFVDAIVALDDTDAETRRVEPAPISDRFIARRFCVTA